MEREVFSQFHPLTNFLYFLAVICFSAVLQHPAYLLAGFLGGSACLLLLCGKKGLLRLLALVPLFLVLTAVNPLLNVQGRTVLFYVLGRRYTWEALCHGAAVSALLMNMLIWFGCYSKVMTGDQFICLFGRLMPGLSLLLVMILRLIPGLIRRGKQILNARRCIGKGPEEQARGWERVRAGSQILSALTDWALEGSITTADSMRCRGYGTGTRSSYRRYVLKKRDHLVIALILGLSLAVLLRGGFGATYTPRIRLEAPGWGLGAYCLLLLIPVIIAGEETLRWHISVSKI